MSLQLGDIVIAQVQSFYREKLFCPSAVNAADLVMMSAKETKQALGMQWYFSRHPGTENTSASLSSLRHKHRRGVLRCVTSKYAL